MFGKKKVERSIKEESYKDSYFISVARWGCREISWSASSSRGDRRKLAHGCLKKLSLVQGKEKKRDWQKPLQPCWVGERKKLLSRQDRFRETAIKWDPSRSSVTSSGLTSWTRLLRDLGNGAGVVLLSAHDSHRIVRWKCVPFRKLQGMQQIGGGYFSLRLGSSNLKKGKGAVAENFQEKGPGSYRGRKEKREITRKSQSIGERAWGPHCPGSRSERLKAGRRIDANLWREV